MCGTTDAVAYCCCCTIQLWACRSSSLSSCQRFSNVHPAAIKLGFFCFDVALSGSCDQSASPKVGVRSWMFHIMPPHNF